jgi:pimeloyl-ACP methyl ester carboxylesterase
MKDPAFKEKALLRLESMFENTRTCRLEHVGHFPQEEAPEEVLLVLESFLKADSVGKVD